MVVAAAAVSPDSLLLLLPVTVTSPLFSEAAPHNSCDEIAVTAAASHFALPGTEEESREGQNVISQYLRNFLRNKNILSQLTTINNKPFSPLNSEVLHTHVATFVLASSLKRPEIEFHFYCPGITHAHG